MSMHDQPFDDHSVSYGGSEPGSPTSSARSSNINPHASPAANARAAMRARRGGVPDSASGSQMTSSSTYSEET